MTVVPGGSSSSEVSEDYVARLFTARYRERFRFDHDAGRWYEWSGTRWQADGVNKVFDCCRSLCREASESLRAKAQLSARRSAFVAGVEKMLRADPVHAVTQDIWDRDPFLLGSPGATIDLATGASRPP
ncbi:MAG: hypothetical protein AAFU70_12385, partial [Planctomycetota bacterium]